MGGSQTKGTPSGVPIVRTLAYLGSKLGSPHFGKPPQTMFGVPTIPIIPVVLRIFQHLKVRWTAPPSHRDDKRQEGLF